MLEDRRPQVTTEMSNTRSLPDENAQHQPAAALAAEPIAELTWSIDEVKAQISHHYKELLQAVLALLAVCVTMALKGRTKPLSLMFEGGSGTGKTAVVQMLFASDELNMSAFIYRSDKFTPKSFVTHAANRKKSELAGIDMLPQLKNKVLLCKELAPIFRGREEEMRENFSTLISVLDGKGFASNSGMCGKRGYEKAILFNWIGATTPLPDSTHRLMYQLGTRILFFEVDSAELTDDDLMEYAKTGDADGAEWACGDIVKYFLLGFFEQHPVASIPLESIAIPEPMMKQLVRWARFVCKGRTEVKWDRPGKGEKGGSNWTPIAAMKPEKPYKVYNYLKEIAMGHALIHERREITQADVDLVAHVAISSIPGHLRPLIRELQTKAEVTSTQATALCRVSRQTARMYLLELSLLGIVNLTKGLEKTEQPDTIKLADDYCWLNAALTQPANVLEFPARRKGA